MSTIRAEGPARVIRRSLQANDGSGSTRRALRFVVRGAQRGGRTRQRFEQRLQLAAVRGARHRRMAAASQLSIELGISRLQKKPD